MPERGKYIVIEGGDGTGKSTQVDRVDTYLRSIGRDTVHTYNVDTNSIGPLQEPGGTPYADELRKRIKDKTIARTPWQNVEMFTEARVSAWNDVLNTGLEQGKDAAAARSFISTVAYQGFGEGVSIEEIEQYTHDHVGKQYMNPDLVVILALKNERQRRERLQTRNPNDSTLDTFESLPAEFQTSMQSGYVQYAEMRGYPILDASKSQDVVFEDIRKLIDDIL